MTKEKIKNAWEKHTVVMTLGIVGILASFYMIYKNSK